MSELPSRAAVIDREFLELRAELLKLAAALDRLDRASDSAENHAAQHDPRLAQIRHGLELLLSRTSDRAEQVQLAFSRNFEPDWREKFKLTPR